MTTALPRLAVFDCDGTLVDSQANIIRAMDDTFAAAGLAPPPHAATRRIVGLSLVEAMRALHPAGDAADHRRLAAEYKDVYHALRTRGALVDEPLFDAMAETLATLAESGWRLAVATGKSDRGLAHVLARHGISDRFMSLQTADRHPSKPDPAMLHATIAQGDTTAARTAMIGDTSFDMAMARAAGAHAIGVAWGYHDPHDLVAAGAQVVAARVADLPRLLDAAVAA